MKNGKFYILGFILILLILTIPISFAADNTTITNTIQNNTNTNNINQNNINTENNTINNQNTTTTITLENNTTTEAITFNVSGTTINSANNIDYDYTPTENTPNDESVLTGTPINIIKINTNNILKDLKNNPITDNTFTNTIYHFINTQASIDVSTVNSGSYIKINTKTFIGTLNLNIYVSPEIYLVKANTSLNGHYTLTNENKLSLNQNNNQLENTIITGLFGNTHKYSTTIKDTKESGKTVTIGTSNNINNNENNLNGTYKLPF